MKLNLNTLAIIVTFVTSAVGGTWFVLDHIYVKIDNVRRDITKSVKHPQYDYIPRNEYKEDIERILDKIEKLDDKLTETIISTKKARFHNFPKKKEDVLRR